MVNVGKHTIHGASGFLFERAMRLKWQDLNDLTKGHLSHGF